MFVLMFVLIFSADMKIKSESDLFGVNAPAYNTLYVPQIVKLGRSYNFAIRCAVQMTWTRHKSQFLLDNELMGSNHQTTNLVIPNFLHEFFSVWAIEKENKLFKYDPKKSWKRNHKIRRFGIRWLMVWSHELVTYSLYQIHTIKYVFAVFSPKIGNDPPFFLSFIFGKLKNSKINPKTQILVHCG